MLFVLLYNLKVVRNQNIKQYEHLFHEAVLKNKYDL